MYNSYFLPCLPPLALLGGWVLWRRERQHDRLWVAAALAALLLVGWRTATVGRVVESTRADLTQMRGGQRFPYLERFGGYGNGRGYSARANAELTAWLAAHTTPEDRVFIFGMQPGVYFEARRLPANRFLWVGPTVAGLLPDPAFTLDQLAADLGRAAPAVLVREANNRDSLLGWTVQEQFAKPPMQPLLRDYDEAATIEDFTIYRRRSALRP